MNWNEFLIETIELYRSEFAKLSPEVREEIRKDFFDETLLKPCQIEVLVSAGEVECLIIHNKDLDDMQIEIREDSKTYEAREFAAKAG